MYDLLCYIWYYGELFCFSFDSNNVRFCHCSPLIVNISTDDVLVLGIGQKLVYLYGSTLDLRKLYCLTVHILVNRILFRICNSIPSELYAVFGRCCFYDNVPLHRLRCWFRELPEQM